MRCPGETKLESIRLLMDAGLDISAVDGSGATLLHIAAREALLRIAELLVELGVPINHRDKDGKPVYEICNDARSLSRQETKPTVIDGILRRSLFFLDTLYAEK